MSRGKRPATMAAAMPFRAPSAHAVLLAALLSGVVITPPAAADAHTIRTTLVVIAEDGVRRADVTAWGAGVRAGLRRVRGVDYADSVDLLSATDTPAEVLTAMDELEALREELRSAPGPRLRKRAERALEVLMQNLGAVKRSVLVDALLTAAVTICDADESACDAAFARVIAMREDMTYDTERFPARYLDAFTVAQAKLLDGGVRGQLEIVTEPIGAEVFVDGRSLGPSPAVAAGLLGGEHFITAKAAGFEKALLVAAVEPGRTVPVTLELRTSERALLLENDLPSIKKELGEPRAGRAIAGVSSYLFAQQVVFATLRRRGSGALEAFVYLYDLRTKFMLRTLDAQLESGESLAELAERLTKDLYRGVDLEGAVAAPKEPEVEDDGAFYKQWWFWAAVGVVAVSGGVAVGVAASADGGGEGAPEGWTRVRGTIQ